MQITRFFYPPLFTFLLLLAGQSLSAQRFDGLSESIDQGAFGNLTAVVISQRGEIIYEEYFRGTQADDLHQVMSVTKSVGSALIGIAHRQGKIRLDQDLAFFFSAHYPMSDGMYQDKAAISVEQVLQQRHGIQWDEASTDYRNPLNPVSRMLESDDWYRFVLTQPMDAQPGAKFSYSTGASTLMSRMIRVASGMGPDEYAMQELFGPLGIDEVHWEGYSEQGMGHGMMNWPNPDQDVSLGYSLWMKPHDMLKIGELYLNGGVYGGKQILDPAWVDASWAKYTHAGNSDYSQLPGWGHGYQWWIAEFMDAHNRNWHVYFASGWGSQVIFVVPELELVLVTTADNFDYNGPDVDVLLYSVMGELNPWLDSRFNGAWYNPATDGQGFNLEIQENGSIVSFWYTYTADGRQRWFLLQGEVVDGIGEVTIYETSGGVFLQNDPYMLGEWGTGRILAADCDHITIEFESDEVSTSIPLTRLTGICFTPPAVNND